MVALHTSPLDQPGTGDAGGLNVYVMEQAKALARLGHHVCLATRRTTPEQPERATVMPGVEVLHVTAGPAGPMLKDDLHTIVDDFSAALKTLLDPLPDVIHAHYWLAGAAADTVGKALDVPVVHTMHTLGLVKNNVLGPEDQPEPALRIHGERQLLAGAAAVIANTDDEARDLTTLYDVPTSKIRVISPGVDTALFAPACASQRRQDRAALGVTDDEVVVLFVGRVQKLKGPDVLVRAAARLAADVPGLTVLINGGSSGTGPVTVEALQDLAADLGLTAGPRPVVRFVDPVPRPELAAMYRAADVLAMPSQHESFGLVAIEAQACGTPVVATCVGGLSRAVRHGQTGILVDGRDPQQWAAAMRPVLTDPVARHRMGRAAVLHAADFQWTAAVGQAVQVYRSVVRTMQPEAS